MGQGQGYVHAAEGSPQVADRRADVGCEGRGRARPAEQQRTRRWCRGIQLGFHAWRWRCRWLRRCRNFRGRRFRRVRRHSQRFWSRCFPVPEDVRPAHSVHSFRRCSSKFRRAISRCTRSSRRSVPLHPSASTRPRSAGSRTRRRRRLLNTRVVSRAPRPRAHAAAARALRSTT